MNSIHYDDEIEESIFEDVEDLDIDKYDRPCVMDSDEKCYNCGICK